MMIRLLYWPLQVLGLAVILWYGAFPRTAWPATPTPVPLPTCDPRNIIIPKGGCYNDVPAPPSTAEATHREICLR
jgi:hypothetical protein